MGIALSQLLSLSNGEWYTRYLSISLSLMSNILLTISKIFSIDLIYALFPVSKMRLWG